MAREMIEAFIAAAPRRRRYAATAKRDWRAMWDAAPASPAGAEVVREPYDPTTQTFDEPFRHVERDIVHRLTERAALARAEDNATARADARHFEEAATLITSLRDALSDAAYIACLQRDDHSERGWFIVGWQGGRHSIPNNEEQAWLYRRGMVARMAADPRPETEADRWCRHFTEKAVKTIENDGLEECGNWSATDPVKVEGSSDVA